MRWQEGEERALPAVEALHVLVNHLIRFACMVKDIQLEFTKDKNMYDVQTHILIQINSRFNGTFKFHSRKKLKTSHWYICIQGCFL